MKRNISVYLRNTSLDPASYYRICQYIKPGKHIGIYGYSPDWIFRLTRGCDDRPFLRSFFYGLMFLAGTFRQLSRLLADRFIRKPGVIVIVREVFPRLIPPGGKSLLKGVIRMADRFIWDIDDHILFDKEISKKEWTLLENNASFLTTPSHYLARTTRLPEERILILPTTDLSFAGDDISSFIEKRKQSFDTEINLVWTGSFGNLKYLRKIIGQLDEAAEELLAASGKKLKLKIISNLPLEKVMLRCLAVVNYRWTRETSRQEVLSSHIGLMPLDDGEYARGKAGFKGVQYMAAGLPILVSDVEFNRKLVKENGYLVPEGGSWASLLTGLCSDVNLWEVFSRNSRKEWEERFNPHYNLETLQTLTNLKENFQLKR